MGSFFKSQKKQPGGKLDVRKEVLNIPGVLNVGGWAPTIRVISFVFISRPYPCTLTRKEEIKIIMTPIHPISFF